MTVSRAAAVVVFVLVRLAPDAAAQTAQPGMAGVPRVIAYAGTLVDANGQPSTPPATLTFVIHAEASGGTALWSEQHTVQPDAQGRYNVLLGSNSADGLPVDIFADGAARWLGVRVNQGEEVGPRAMLVSVPYALKAGDAETFGGRTIDQFVLAPTPDSGGEGSQNAPPPASMVAISSDFGIQAVTAGYLQKGDGLGATTDSTVFETSGNIGVGTTAPQARFHAYGADNTANAFPEILIGDSTPAALGVGGGFGFQGKYTAGSSDATFAAVKGGKETATLGNYAGYLSFWTQPGSLTERMRIASSGNVGIGTIAPFARLHVVAAPGTQAAQLVGRDNTADAFPAVIISDDNFVGANVGGGFGLQGKYTGAGAFATFAAVKGGKDNGSEGSYTGYLALYTQGGTLTERVRISSGGNVGIGTTTPQAKLHVAGDVIVDGNIGAKYQDVAEWVESDEPLEAGTLVVIDPGAANRVRAAARAYDTSVVGAVSAQPGILLGEPGPDKILVAQSGRVRVKVDARYGAIRPGDLLVTSPRKGYAMRSRPLVVGGAPMHRPGTLVGKALQPLLKGDGEILVLLTLQ